MAKSIGNSSAVDLFDFHYLSAIWGARDPGGGGGGGF